jgi:hypothetical protein
MNETLTRLSEVIILGMWGMMPALNTHPVVRGDNLEHVGHDARPQDKLSHLGAVTRHVDQRPDGFFGQGGVRAGDQRQQVWSATRTCNQASHQSYELNMENNKTKRYKRNYHKGAHPNKKIHFILFQKIIFILFYEIICCRNYSNFCRR